MNPDSGPTQLSRQPHPAIPRKLGAIAAVLFFAWAIRFSIEDETPAGSIAGRVMLSDSGKPLSGAVIDITGARSNEGYLSRRAISGTDGRFVVSRLPEGDYLVSASSFAHVARGVNLAVTEGDSTDVSIEMERSQPDLALAQHQRVFGTEEKPVLPLRGYVNPKAPRGTDELKVTVYASKLSRLLGQQETASALNALGESYHNSDSTDESGRIPKMLRLSHAVVPVGTRHERIVGAGIEGFFYQKLNYRKMFGALRPGIYLTEVEHDRKTVSGWILVTDTALVIKRAGLRCVSFTANLQTGRPVAGCAVKTFRDGAVIASRDSNAQGISEFDVPPPGRSEEGAPGGRSSTDIVVAVNGEDESVVQRNAFDNEDSGQYAAFLYTDRPIYRPGQRIQFKSIFRRFEQERAQSISAVPGIPHPYSVPSGIPVHVELRDPTGEKMLDTKIPTTRGGTMAGAADLPSEARTGVYSLVTTLEGETHTQDVVVAAYQKPEYQVTVTPQPARVSRGEPLQFRVSAQYYFGSPVAGARVKYSIYRTADWESDNLASGQDDAENDSEDAWQNADNGDQHAYYGRSAGRGETHLDASGAALISVNTSSDDDNSGSGAETYTISVTVVEGADREQEASGSATVTSGDFTLSVIPDGNYASPGTPTPITLIAADWDRHRLPNIAVSLQVLKYVWNDDDHAGEYRSVGTFKALTGADGTVKVMFPARVEGNYTLKASAQDAKKHMIWGHNELWCSSDAGGDFDTVSTDLSVLTDHRQYSPGQTVKALVNVRKPGETVLLTIEGNHVYRAWTVALTHKSTVVKFPVEEQFGPDVYLNACYVKSKRIATSEIALHVSMPRRSLKLTLTPDRAALEKGKLPRYQPGDRLSYLVHTADTAGKPVPAELSLGVVDEAIYALRQDTPTAIREAFYPKRSNRVQTDYSFAVVYMGDANKAEPLIAARKKFPDTAYWNPYVMTGADGNARVSFNLPDNLTTWRCTALAVTDETQIGRCVNKVQVSKDFFVRLETSRTLTQSDESVITGMIHNETGVRQSGVVRLEAPLLAVKGAATQTLTLEPGEIRRVNWPITATAPGDATIRLTAFTALENGRRYTDGVEMKITVRPFGRVLAGTFAGEASGGASANEVIRMDPSAIASESRLTIRITPSIQSAMLGGLQYLTGFPYGCTEQTMSRFLPDMAAQKIMHAHGVLDISDAGKLPEMVRNSMLRLYRFQHASGGWGWWENDADDAWMTAYVVYGLSRARDMGYPINKEVMQHGAHALKEMMSLAEIPLSKEKKRRHDQIHDRAHNEFQINTEPVTHAFAVYALAVSGDRSAAAAALSRFNLRTAGPNALGYLILTARRLGLPYDSALAIWSAQAVYQDQMIHWKSTGEDGWDDSLATAVGLRVLVAINPHDPRIPAVLRWIMSERTDCYWSSTRDTSWVLDAMTEYLRGSWKESSRGIARVSINGRLFQTVTLDAQARQEKEIVLRVPPSLLRLKNDVSISTGVGQLPLFYSVDWKQMVAMNAPIALASTNGMTVVREYLRVDSTTDETGYPKQNLTEMHGQFKSGDSVRVKLTIKLSRDTTYVIIEDPFPAGCEVTERGRAENSDNWSYWWDNTDVRDDRIAFFARRMKAGKYVITYNLRAKTAGVYHALPPLVQPMYSPQYQAAAQDNLVSVNDQ